MDNAERMRALVNRLNETAHAYYVLDNPLISDAEWDKLYDQLLHLERETGVVLPDSPSLRVGGEPLKAFPSHRHVSRLWSMDKAQSVGELRAWFDRVGKLAAQAGDLPTPEYAVEYKFDGLTINLTYDRGILVHAATRGNGIVGEEILAQARTVRGVPLSIPYQGFIEVQGECIMRLSALAAYNKTADEPLKNARNAAAGALRNLDPQVTASRRLSAFFYQIGTIDHPPYDDLAGMLAFMTAQGFAVSPYCGAAKSEEDVLRLIADIEAKRDTLDFLIDGAVIKITNSRIRDALGYTDKFPRWAIAYKFVAEENTATLERVTWELGRTGKLTPLAHLSPVDFAGVTVSKATLNNMGDIRRKNLALGRRVWVRRSNDVIPEITGCVDDGAVGDDILPPSVCPVCGGELTERGANLYCMNRASCRAQAVMRLKHFASRDAMDIESFSEKTAGQLYDQMNVRDAADLYRLKAGDLIPLEGFQEKRAQNLIAALDKSRDCALDAFLYALGIPNIGRRTARDLASRFGTLDAARRATYDDLIAIDEIGDIVANSVVDFFSFPENERMIDRLLDAGVRPREQAAAKREGALTGKTIVPTGKLPTLTRGDAEKLITENGGVFGTSVSKKTDYVLAGEDAGSKLDKARALGIPVIGEDEFLRMIGR